jgi:hypothetical protein
METVLRAGVSAVVDGHARVAEQKKGIYYTVRERERERERNFVQGSLEPELKYNFVRVSLVVLTTIEGFWAQFLQKSKILRKLL